MAESEVLEATVQGFTDHREESMTKLTFRIGMGIGLLVTAATIVAAQNSLVLTGRTTNVRVTEDKNSVVLTVTLDLTITNESLQNMILLCHEFQIVGDVISQSVDQTTPKRLFRSSSLPSINRSPHWANLQKQLNTSSPPPGLTRILSSGESISFDRTTTISIYKKGLYQASWQEILAFSPVWLQVELDMFPSNLDRTSLSQKSFGKKLKKKWSSFGVLQIDVLKSAPIRLDLNIP